MTGGRTGMPSTILSAATDCAGAPHIVAARTNAATKTIHIFFI